MRPVIAWPMDERPRGVILAAAWAKTLAGSAGARSARATRCLACINGESIGSNAPAVAG
jgi:hypothetical protein